MITRINHIAIVAPDLDEATGFWADALGLPVSRVADVPDERCALRFCRSVKATLSCCSQRATTAAWRAIYRSAGPACTISAWKWMNWMPPWRS